MLHSFSFFSKIKKTNKNFKISFIFLIIFLQIAVSILSENTFTYAFHSSENNNKTYLNISDTTQGANHIFQITQDENINFELSNSYDSVAVKIKNSDNISPIILFSENSGNSWHMLNFNTDSKTDISETNEESFLYSDLLFIKNTSQHFMFKTKFINKNNLNKNVEFIFLKDDILENTTASLYSQNNSDIQNLGYTRDNTFFRENGIIKREEWGANEIYRYIDPNKPIPTYKPSPNTALSARAKACNESYSQNPKDFIKSEEVFSDENGKLKWQYQYSPEIKKIIIHHTGTNNSKYIGKTPEEIMRATYKFHSSTKGWGDIGYNFLISKSGAIYEGRAGGDFVIGGHAYCANTQTIGISLMGNYEDETMNKAQMIALKRLITGLSKKYHINPSDSSYFIGKNTPNLVGHKDYGNTLCPGKNVYKYLQNIRDTFIGKNFGDIPAYYNPYGIPEYTNNFATQPPTPTPISTVSLLQIPVLSVQASLISRPTLGDLNKNLSNNTNYKNNKVTQTQKSHILPPKENIRIKLSYSSDMVQIKGNNMNIEISNLTDTNITKKKRVIITTQKNKNSQKTELFINNVAVKKIRISNENYKTPLKIASWARPLAWAPKTHDNLFLGTLEFRIIDNKLVIINELLLEDYIKGIAEVSNNAPFEKQKVIAVISRTYAQFYMDKNHTKFPNMPYDGDDNPDHFQKYRGYGYQKRSPLFEQAVNSTKSEVVSFNNKIVKTPFFSESAGKTFSAKEKWGWTHTPYLQSVNDVFCKNGKGELKGHGVGLSGCGAETMAKRGFSYKDIIKYYYKDVEIY